MQNHRRLTDEYKIQGFKPKAFVDEQLGDPDVRIVTLVRYKKNRMWHLWRGF